MEATLSVQGEDANWERTFTTAHVDNNFQGRLLSCQQRYGLSQLLVSGLKGKKSKKPILNVWENSFS